MATGAAASGNLLVRELLASDGPAVRSLVSPEIDRLPYREGVRSALEAAIAGTDPDARALIGLLGEQVVGVAVYGGIAGAIGAGRLQLIVTHPNARRQGVATTLVTRAIDALQREGMRFVSVELPDDPTLAQSSRLLLRCAFHIEATVPDFFRDGVDLTLLRLDL